jgi:hypothetical protein
LNLFPGVPHWCLGRTAGVGQGRQLGGGGHGVHSWVADCCHAHCRLRLRVPNHRGRN